VTSRHTAAAIVATTSREFIADLPTRITGTIAGVLDVVTMDSNGKEDIALRHRLINGLFEFMRRRAHFSRIWRQATQKKLRAKQRIESRRRSLESRRARREETRRKILVGAVVLARIEQALLEESVLWGWLEGAVERAPVMGSVRHIFVEPQRGAPMQPLGAVMALTDIDLDGDRYAIQKNRKSLDYQLTLIEVEHIEAFAAAFRLPVAPDNPHRNLVTAGVDLNAFCGRRFMVGAVRGAAGIDGGGW
jgi:hypothetical protein